MKRSIIISILVSISLFIHAQSLLRYDFHNSLNEVKGVGPPLTILGVAGVYTTDTLNEIEGNSKTVYRFEKNSGLQFNNNSAGNFIGQSYTIELYFVFDELDSWKRVVDWKNRKTDDGAYVYYGQLNFYPILYSDEAPVVAGEYTYYVLTRDATSKKVLIYTDADEKIEFTDSNDDALIDSDGVLNFFFDDLVVPNEASSGAVAMMNIYDYVLDSATIQDNWNSIGSTVFGTGQIHNTTYINVSPNPATDLINVFFPNFGILTDVRISILDELGHQVFSSFSKASILPYQINTSSFKKGIYFIKIEGERQYCTSKFILI